MTDRPIIFSAPMVRALLDGRKSQTRRVLAPSADRLICRSCGVSEREFKANACRCETNCLAWTPCDVPKWRKGDRLWVRENWTACGTGVWTIADARTWIASDQKLYFAADEGNPTYLKWWPSIHMPREFSRLTLAVTEVRVERLQDISEADAVAEGWPHAEADPTRIWIRDKTPEGWFRGLWEDLNGSEAWTANPWVAAISFTVHRTNIDALSMERAA